jgi:hypothetical protein
MPNRLLQQTPMVSTAARIQAVAEIGNQQSGTRKIAMPRTARATQAGYSYNVHNRGNGHKTVLHKDADLNAFVKLLKEVGERTPIRLLSYSLMPNHFHLAVLAAAI